MRKIIKTPAKLFSLPVVSFFFLSVIIIIGPPACKYSVKKPVPKQGFWVGTYTEGESKGIYRYFMDGDGKLSGGLLATQTENPSYLCKSSDGKYLISVNEVENDKQGAISSYSISGDSLFPVGQSITGGAHPCFVASDLNGYVIAANYTGGNVGLLQLKEDGSLSPLLDVQNHTGSGPTERQLGPHAHSCYFQPGSGLIISVDLGTDALWVSSIQKEGEVAQFTEATRFSLPAGAGPRHLAFHPTSKYIYVINELNSTISVIQQESDNSMNVVQHISTVPADFSGDNFCADVHISKDGKYLYASNRGHNSLAVFSVMENGTLNAKTHHETRGDWPRNFTFSPDQKFILVANQKSHQIVSFSRDTLSGILSPIDTIHAPSPVCLLF